MTSAAQNPQHYVQQICNANGCFFFYSKSYKSPLLDIRWFQNNDKYIFYGFILNHDLDFVFMYLFYTYTYIYMNIWMVSYVIFNHMIHQYNDLLAHESLVKKNVFVCIYSRPGLSRAFLIPNVRIRVNDYQCFKWFPNEWLIWAFTVSQNIYPAQIDYIAFYYYYWLHIVTCALEISELAIRYSFITEYTLSDSLSHYYVSKSMRYTCYTYYCHYIYLLYRVDKQIDRSSA